MEIGHKSLTPKSIWLYKAFKDGKIKCVGLTPFLTLVGCLRGGTSELDTCLR